MTRPILAALVVAPILTGSQLRASQYQGWYPNSPPASLFFSDLLRMVCFLGLWLGRALMVSSPSGLGDEVYRHRLRPEKEEEAHEGNGEFPAAMSSRRKLLADDGSQNGGMRRPGAAVSWSKLMHPRRAVQMLEADFSPAEVWGQRSQLVMVALLQTVVNNLAFAALQVADPGTAHLFKCCMPFMGLAILGRVRSNTSPKGLMLAIIVMVLGFIAAQLGPGGGGLLYPLMAYPILVAYSLLAEAEAEVQTALSAPHDDWNILVCRNALVAGFGAGCNLVLHVVLRFVNAEEPGLLTGYWQPGVVFIVFANAFAGVAGALAHGVGLVTRLLTAVPSALFLLYCSEVFFETSFGPLSGVGVLVIGAGIVVVVFKLAGDGNTAMPVSASRISKLFSPVNYTALISFICITLVIAICARFAGLAYSIPPPPNPWSVDMCGPPPTSQIPEFKLEGYPLELIGSGHNTSNSPDETLLTSPFANTLALIRLNERRPERIPDLMKYAPFFHTIHISMRDALPSQAPTFHNLTHDQYPDGERTYIQLARTMQLLLDDQQHHHQHEIDGLLYFHFDAWIDPLAFAGGNLHNIWYPTGHNTRRPYFEGMRFSCMTDPDDGYPGWMGWQRKWHVNAQRAVRAVADLGLGYDVLQSSSSSTTGTTEEYCIGWSDIYYLPRRFFADFVLLAHVFGCENVHHELAVPTILHIIDRSRRATPFRSVIDRVGDCFGGCRDASARVEDVLFSRCGHQLDHRQQSLVDAHYGRLDREAEALGKPMF